MNRETIFSPCRKYRYTLWREWPAPAVQFTELVDPNHYFSPPRGTHEKYVQFIGLNPSTADETQDDPTIRRCIGFAKRWGFGAMCMTNLFGFRATDPDDMMAEPEPLGFRSDNAQWIERIALTAGLIVCAWGIHGQWKDRGQKVVEHLRDVKGLKVHHLGLTSKGFPKHPLYLKSETTPIEWTK